MKAHSFRLQLTSRAAFVKHPKVIYSVCDYACLIVKGEFLLIGGQAAN